MKDLLDFADDLDYFEEDSLDSQTPNTMHIRENTILPRPTKRVHLGQTRSCAWFLTKGFNTA